MLQFPHQLCTGDGPLPVRHFDGPRLRIGLCWCQNLGRQRYRFARWGRTFKIAGDFLAALAVAACFVLAMCL